MAAALAMVFSVQQGEHGPLVVYKLEVPRQAAPATPPLTSSPSTALPLARGPTFAIPSRAPRVLGTVVIPAATARPAAARRPAPQGVTLLEIARPALGGAASANWAQGRFPTLEEVNNDIVWRRDTVGKLRAVGIAPRF